VQELNKPFRHGKATADRSLRYTPVDRETLRLRVYEDASIFRNIDFSSLLGTVVLLCGGQDRRHVLTDSRKTSRRVVPSVMAEEVFAFVDSFDAAYIIKSGLERIHRHQRRALAARPDDGRLPPALVWPAEAPGNAGG